MGEYSVGQLFEPTDRKVVRLTPCFLQERPMTAEQTCTLGDEVITMLAGGI